MKILKIRILRGPNYWSNYRNKLIVFTLDLEKYEYLPTNLLPKFTVNLTQLLPTLREHYCSRDGEGGFIQRMEEGTWLGHVIEHVAIELQCLAGMRCCYGRTRETQNKGIYHIAYEYMGENAGLYAGHTAIRIVEAIINQEDYSNLDADIEKLRQLYQDEKFGPTTQAIIQEAITRKIPYLRLNDQSLVMLGQGCRQKLICAAETSDTSSIGADIAKNKEETKRLLRSNFIPVPDGYTISSTDELNDVIEYLGFPLVIKPINGNHGRGISTNIQNRQDAMTAFDLAQSISNDVLVERFVKGMDYRFLIVNYKLIAVALLERAKVVGDGRSTIAELIDEINKDPRRGLGHENVLTKIEIDDVTKKILEDNNYTLATILRVDETLPLKYTANLSTGGMSIDVTDLVHPDNRLLAERIARLMHLDICGIDIIIEDIHQSILKQKSAAVLEVNAGPGFRMHLYPSQGKPRNVAKPVIDMLFPDDKARIPVVAVTGTNGKTSVVRLIDYFARSMGYRVGYTTTEGIYINEQHIFKGDCSGPESAQTVLKDPLVDFAIFECARGGIIRSGLGFDLCDISILTNVSEDHLGLDEIHTLEELAQVKSVVPYSTKPDGYAILNAEDALVYALKDDLRCNIALFALVENANIVEHHQEGGLAAFIKDDWIIVCRGGKKIKLIKVSEIPFCFSGHAIAMVKNVLPVILTAIILNCSDENIRLLLKSLHPTTKNFPGRMNVYEFNQYTVLLDYAHNEDAYVDLRKYFDNIQDRKKIGIIAGTGDRRDQDIRNIGYQAGLTFDEIIIRHDRDSRGRTNDQITTLLMQGITNANAHANVKVISDEFEALHAAMNDALPSSYIYYFPDDVLTAIDYLASIYPSFTERMQVEVREKASEEGTL